MFWCCWPAKHIVPFTRTPKSGAAFLQLSHEIAEATACLQTLICSLALCALGQAQCPLTAACRCVLPLLPPSCRHWPSELQAADLGVACALGIAGSVYGILMMQELVMQQCYCPKVKAPVLVLLLGIRATCVQQLWIWFLAPSCDCACIS